MSKNRRLHVMSLVIFVFIILSLSTVTAQNSLGEQPLLKMLAHVPDNAISRSEITFNDRKAIEAAYPPAQIPADYAAFNTLQADKTGNKDLFPNHIWWQVWFRNNSSQMAEYFAKYDQMPAAIGIDFFSIDQELNYGEPPKQTLQITGQFDLDKVRAALTANGFSLQGGLWCSPDGCENGNKLNPASINPANPFGGNLGRKEPMLLQDGVLIGSPSNDVMQAHIGVTAGTTKSLADAPEYRAAVAALTSADSVLLQAYFWDGDVLAKMNQLPAILDRASGTIRKKLIEDILKDYEELPAYQLLAFGDTTTDQDQAAEVALVYATRADAETAAGVLPKRIANYLSAVANRRLADMLTDLRVKEPVITTIDSGVNAGGGPFVVVIRLSTPKATPDQILAMSPKNTNLPDVTAPGIVYHLLVTGAMREDVGWLSTAPRALWEAAAK